MITEFACRRLGSEVWRESALLQQHDVAFSSISEILLAANVLMLGFAFQRGCLPLSEHAASGVELNGVAVQANLDAFAGRILAVDEVQ